MLRKTRRARQDTQAMPLLPLLYYSGSGYHCFHYYYFGSSAVPNAGNRIRHWPCKARHAVRGKTARATQDTPCAARHAVRNSTHRARHDTPCDARHAVQGKTRRATQVAPCAARHAVRNSTRRARHDTPCDTGHALGSMPLAVSPGQHALGSKPSRLAYHKPRPPQAALYKDRALHRQCFTQAEPYTGRAIHTPCPWQISGSTLTFMVPPFYFFSESSITIIKKFDMI